MTLTEMREVYRFVGCFPWIFRDFLDEPSLCSWTNFGKLATSGKVHYCSKSLLFVVSFTVDLWSPRTSEIAL